MRIAFHALIPTPINTVKFTTRKVSGCFNSLELRNSSFCCVVLATLQYFSDDWLIFVRMFARPKKKLCRTKYPEKILTFSSH